MSDFKIDKIFKITLLACFMISDAWGSELRDVKPPVPYPSTWGFFLIMAFVFILLAGAIARILLYKKKKKYANNIRVPEIPPWRRAFTRLDLLGEENLLAQRQLKKYYRRLSDILRRYFEEEFHINAPEMTTEEFLNYLKNYSRFTNVQKNILKKFLISCDMVKFAKYDPGMEDARRSMDTVRNLIRETRCDSLPGEEQNT